MAQPRSSVRVGWASWLARISMFVLLFEAITGLAITFGPFHPVVQWGVVAHTILGIALLIPMAAYYAWHWDDYKSYSLTYVVLLGYVGLAGLIVCTLSGIVVTWQGLFGIKTSSLWRTIHLVSTFVVLIPGLLHVAFILSRVWSRPESRASRGFVLTTVVATVVGMVAMGVLGVVYSGTEYVNEFPSDYSFLYGEDRAFAPSLARTTTGGAYDARSLSGSESCGTSGCHEEILEEWTPSAHRYAAKDVLFQGIQNVMAQQNGPESTRYCGGCHDPISLFSGTKNIFVEDLTGLQGYQEGVSCLACHAIRETDVQGNANYLIAQPSEYLWQWSTSGLSRVMRDFLIRTYPAQHNTLSKRLYKAPEYCAACHKQFIDQEVNRVGWVQLQNQYDNWKASHWNAETEDQKRDPKKSIECRECHMPLVDSSDPAAGDTGDYNRKANDGKHRSHRFIASNQMMPKLLELPGWEKQVQLTEEWLKGSFPVPEIADKWTEGPIVKMALEVPESVAPGEKMPIRVVFTSNKVGHDYPTGPLDIIQSWLEIQVTDPDGNVIFTSGTRDDKNFIEPGSFLFKAEPVDQYGNLIDRHNLWEMVGVRYRRALFPGHSDAVEYSVTCPSGVALAPNTKFKQPTGDSAAKSMDVDAPATEGVYRVSAKLQYRKVDQFLLNFLLGEKSGVSAPTVEIDRAEAEVRVRRGT
ncbi:hypothetical protein FJZ36_00480 [Candidatus Poribacteria bacterium]|nr:hypothetical protein [Candidatus Poribacteria bacterium]